MKKLTLMIASAVVALGANATAEKVWEGSFDYGNWAGSENITSPAFANAKAGDVITLVYSEAASGAQYQIAFSEGESGSWIKAVDYDDIAGKRATYTLKGTTVGVDPTSTLTDVELLKAGGFFTGGHDAVLSEVYFGEEYIPNKPAGVETIWTGSEALGTWDKDVKIEGTAFENLCDGDKVIFTVEDAGADARLYVNTQVGDQWTWTTFFKADAIVNNQVEMPVTAEMTGEDADKNPVSFDLNNLKSRGVILKGQNATVVKIEIEHGQGGESAVEAIAAEENAPVEIYTLDGRRVNAMENGIYIVRQGNNVKKVIK